MVIFKTIVVSLLFIDFIYYFYKAIKTEKENAYGFECVKYQLWAIIYLLAMLMVK